MENDLMLKAYDLGIEIAKAHGYKEDIEHLKNRLENPIYKTIEIEIFFREYVWVAFVSGFNAETVGKKWDDISKMVCNFSPEKTNQKFFEDLLEESPIRNKSKVKGIKKASGMITEKWLETIRKPTSRESVMKKLKTLPFIAKVTVFHLMRNIGFNEFKPDRHIENLATIFKIDSTNMVNTIASECKEKFIGVVDFILWKSCAIFGSAKSFLNWVDEHKKGAPIKIFEEKIKKREVHLF